jgi:hypothetical protein
MTERQRIEQLKGNYRHHEAEAAAAKANFKRAEHRKADAIWALINALEGELAEVEREGH